MAKSRQTKGSDSNQKKTESYPYPEADSPLRPDAGTQSEFKKKKEPATYRYDSSLSPVLEWDGQNGARSVDEFLLACMTEAAWLPAPHLFGSPRELKLNNGDLGAKVLGLDDAVQQLKALERPFLNWTGKAERLSFDVPTLPLFVHERLSTAGIIATLKGHRKPQDTKVWEEAAAYSIDTHAKVDAFVKNAGLGFAIQFHDYVPDFIIRLKTDPVVHLILETKGYDERSEIKAHAAERWVNAVNSEGSYGAWSYAMARNPSEVPSAISKAAESALS